MATFDVAHLHEQGQDIIIIVVSHQPSDEQVNMLQAAANQAGLRGTVVPVWKQGFDRFGFMAPTQWHGFFRSLTPDLIAANINRTLTVNW